MTWIDPPDGWYTFGTHVNSEVYLEFSNELDGDGLPLFERPVS